MSEKNEFIDFPCDFQVKIIGNNNTVFIEEITSITATHFPEHDEKTIVKKPSKNNSFLSLSVTVYALNKKQLDDFYREISSHPEVKMVL